MVIQIFIFVLLILVLPLWVGSIFAGVYRGRGSNMFRWISGQFLLWAGFQVIGVLLGLKEEPFFGLEVLYWIYIAALMLFAVGAVIRQRAYGVEAGLLPQRMKKGRFANMVLWIYVLGLLTFQLVQVALMAYGTGAWEVRSELAPFHSWVTFMADVTGMQVATMSQVIVPMALLCMTYGIFYMLGSKLFPEKNGQLPLFLICAEVLILFGDYPFATPDYFLTSGTWRGEAVLASVAVPFLVCLCSMLLRRLKKEEAIPVRLYLLFGVGALTAGLCSVSGALWVCILLPVFGVIVAICYRRPKVLPGLVVSCSPTLLLLLCFYYMFGTEVYQLAAGEVCYRMFVLLPIVLVISYLCVYLYGRWKGAKQGAIVLCMLAVIMVCGRYLYLNDDFAMAENRYHVPAAVVEVCDAMAAPGREVKALFPKEMLPDVQKYAPQLLLPEGQKLQGDAGEAVFLYDVLGAEVIDWARLAPLVAEEQCHYVVFPARKAYEGDPEAYGIMWYGQLSGYAIYRNTNFEVEEPGAAVE